MKKLITFLYWLPALAWMWVIFHFSAVPGEELPAPATASPDYITHGAEYFVLAFLLFLALQRSIRWTFIISFAVTLGWCLLYGLGNELYQLYVPSRGFSMWDVLADGVGVVILFLLLLALQKAGSRGKRIYFLLAGSSR